MSDKTSRLQETLGYQFRDAALLKLALTHRSRGARNNERLEFLGDSILNHIIAEALFQRFEQAHEGEMSRMRAALVKGETLAEVARELDLGGYILLGAGEMKSGGQRRESILADAMEAIIGAVLLDADEAVCRDFVLRLYRERLLQLSIQQPEKDGKTRLQEYLQGRGKALPVYRLHRVEGQDHCQQFTVSCELPEIKLSLHGTGASRRKAEQAAAEATLKELKQGV